MGIKILTHRVGIKILTHRVGIKILTQRVGIKILTPPTWSEVFDWELESEATTIRPYWLVSSLSSKDNTVILPTYTHDTHTHMKYITVIQISYPYRRILDPEWDRRVTQGVGDL